MKKITAGVLLAALCATLFASCAIYRVPEDLRVAVFDNLTKIRREEKLPIAAERELSVSLARNESEGMQFVLNSATQDFKVKNVTVSDLQTMTAAQFFPRRIFPFTVSIICMSMCIIIHIKAIPTATIPTRLSSRNTTLLIMRTVCPLQRATIRDTG